MNESSTQHTRARVRVELGERSYEIVIGSGVCGSLASVLDPLLRDRLGGRCRRALLVIDQSLPSSACSHVEAGLEALGLSVTPVRLEATESRKSIGGLEHLLHALTRGRLERSDLVVALGGGIIGDLAGFAAAVYRRGIALVQMPTTLLSMVDASVGGKTGINLSLDGDDLKKNMAGAFHQPLAVIADIALLQTLPDRQFRAGLAECVKHAMLGADFDEASLLDWMSERSGEILARDPSTITELVRRNVGVKARVVAGDEHERVEADVGRVCLNLGHTFAHAIEALPGVQSIGPAGEALAGEVHHGEAVSMGLRAACHVSVGTGRLTPQERDENLRLLDRLGLCARATGLPASEAILSRMAHDKKNVAGAVRLVLPVGGRRVRLITSPPTEIVLRAIDSIRA